MLRQVNGEPRPRFRHGGRLRVRPRDAPAPPMTRTTLFGLATFVAVATWIKGERRKGLRNGGDPRVGPPEALPVTREEHPNSQVLEADREPSASRLARVVGGRRRTLVSAALFSAAVGIIVGLVLQKSRK